MRQTPAPTDPPWRIIHGRDDCLDIESAADPETQGIYSGRRIAKVPASLGHLRQRANARLIALAPRMLRFIQAGDADPQEARAILRALTHLRIRRP